MSKPSNIIDNVLKKTPKKYSPRRKIRKGNFVLQNVETFLDFIKELNKVFGGLLTVVASIYGKKLLDALYDEFMNWRKSRKYREEFEKCKKTIDNKDESNDAKKLCRQRIEDIDKAYKLLMHKHIINPETDAKYLLTSTRGLFRYSHTNPFHTVEEFVAGLIKAAKDAGKKDLTLDEIQDSLKFGRSRKSRKSSRSKSKRKSRKSRRSRKSRPQRSKSRKLRSRRRT